MSASALVCLAPGSEETEAVTTIEPARMGLPYRKTPACLKW